MVMMRAECMRQCLRRSYATQSSGSGMPAIFNRSVKQLQRLRIAQDPESNRATDYLKDEVADRLVDRLLFLKRQFGHLVDLGSGNGHVARALVSAALRPEDALVLKDRVQKLTMTDLALPLAERDVAETQDTRRDGLAISRLYVDEESIPFEPGSIDAVVSNLALHWVNDLPGSLIQIRRSLVPDGPFLGSMFGGDSLFELRTALQLAELDRQGGLSPHISPMTDVKDVGSLLNRAGFKLTTIDVEDIIVDYPDIFSLMADLQAMGESNAIAQRHGGPISRDVLIAAQAIYRELHGNPDGSIPATFHVIYMIGWAPSAVTPKPQARGSGQASLKETLEQAKTPEDLQNDQAKRKQ